MKLIRLIKAIAPSAIIILGIIIMLLTGWKTDYSVTIGEGAPDGWAWKMLIGLALIGIGSFVMKIKGRIQ